MNCAVYGRALSWVKVTDWAVLVSYTTFHSSITLMYWNTCLGWHFASFYEHQDQIQHLIIIPLSKSFPSSSCWIRKLNATPMQVFDVLPCVVEEHSVCQLFTSQTVCNARTIVASPTSYEKHAAISRRMSVIERRRLSSVTVHTCNTVLFNLMLVLVVFVSSPFLEHQLLSLNVSKIHYILFSKTTMNFGSGTIFYC